jgi:hypothetical protein
MFDQEIHVLIVFLRPSGIKVTNASKRLSFLSGRNRRLLKS